MRLSTPRTIALFLILCGSYPLSAKDKHKPAPPQDQITVAAHLAIPGAPILRFTATRHYDRSYIYAERGPGQPITLLDVTDPAKPIVVSQLDSPADTASLIAAAGTAAISTSAPSSVAKAPAQTIRLMDFSDVAHPKVTQQFENVSAVEKISGAVTLLANPEGIWILTQRLADDPEIDERYARKVIYGESMY
jgi:hypothetical protein